MKEWKLYDCCNNGDDADNGEGLEIMFMVVIMVLLNPWSPHLIDGWMVFLKKGLQVQILLVLIKMIKLSGY